MVKEQRAIHLFFKRKRDELNHDEAAQEREERGPIRVPEPANHGQEQQNHVIFRGIEFLERDPALRPQILEYPSNQQNKVKRAYLKLGPMQPKLQNYKASGPQGHQRRFQQHWFSEFPNWLEYSESNGRAYYFICFVASKNIRKRGGFDTFTAQGFNNWKKVHDGHKERPQSKNRENFVKLIKLLAEFNPEIEKTVLENAPQYAKYTSPDIQKEILSVFPNTGENDKKRRMVERAFGGDIFGEHATDKLTREELRYLFNV